MPKKEPIPENPSPPADINNERTNLNVEVENQNNQQIIKQEPIENKSDMEIHHPHTSHHARKFKDYIFEFLMLFIAVTAGFFMENIREQRVERHKEKQYIQSMIKDIQQDTTNIKDILSHNKIQIIGIDSLLNLLEKPIKPANYNDFYTLILKYLNNYSDFRARNITMTQLKNSGGLRLIEDKSVSDSIVFYYWEYEEHLAQLDFNIKSFQKNIDLEMEFLDWTVIKNGKKKLSISKDFNTKEFSNNVIMLYYIIISENEWIKNYKLKGTSLLNFLKTQYNPN
jgi:hypothetical protein